MDVLAVRFELVLPGLRSLKSKRSVIRPVIEGIRARWSISVSEVDHQDLHQRSAIGMALVGSSAAVIEDVADDIERFVWSRPDLEVAGTERRWMEMN